MIPAVASPLPPPFSKFYHYYRYPRHTTARIYGSNLDHSSFIVDITFVSKIPPGFSPQLH
jgi:hypothetical protein